MFPDLAPEGPERSAASSTRCGWHHRGGYVSVAVTSSSSRPLKDDATAVAREWLDPFRRDAAKNLRVEAVRRVGDDAVAIVEPADLARGIVDSGAVLIVRRRSQQAMVTAPGLANRDRSEALRLLGQLGAAAAARME